MWKVKNTRRKKERRPGVCGGTENAGHRQGEERGGLRIHGAR